MAEFITLEQEGSIGVDNHNYYRFHFYYRLLHAYLTSEVTQTKNEILQQMKDIGSNITFVTVKGAIENNNSIYQIQLI